MLISLLGWVSVFCWAARFLSAAQPTDQGEESVVLFVVVVGGGGHFSSSHVQFFGVWKGKNFVWKGMWKGKKIVPKGVWKSKNFVSKGVWKRKNFVSKGVRLKRQKLCLKRGGKRQKLCLIVVWKGKNCEHHGSLICQKYFVHASDQWKDPFLVEVGKGARRLHIRVSYQ